MYYVQWTVDSPSHDPNFDLVIGPWGEEAETDQRVLVSLLFRPGPLGGFMVINGAGRPPDIRSLCRRALTRAEVIGTWLAEEAFQMVDAIWLQDPRIEEIRSWAKAAEQSPPSQEI